MFYKTAVGAIVAAMYIGVATSETPVPTSLELDHFNTFSDPFDSFNFITFSPTSSPTSTPVEEYFDSSFEEVSQNNVIVEEVKPVEEVYEPESFSLASSGFRSVYNTMSFVVIAVNIFKIII